MAQHYTGELWHLALTTGTTDLIRMAAPVPDMPAAYAAADVVVSAAVQREGVQRALLEAQAMTGPISRRGLTSCLLPPPFPTVEWPGYAFVPKTTQGWRVPWPVCSRCLGSCVRAWTCGRD
jgi:hypothetical protein